MITISESKMNFGEFYEEDLFHIEDSKIYKDLGDGIKTVEFILKYNKETILFLEAKESCPNVANKHESEEKERKFEEYYASITEKFFHSLQIYLASILKRYEDTSDVGKNLNSAKEMNKIKIRFVLIIKNAKLEWLAGPMSELKERLLQIRKIWSVEVVVLNEELAKEHKLIC